MAAGEENVWWGNLGKNEGVWGEAPRKNLLTTPFKRSENVGNALFDIFSGNLLENFLHIFSSFRSAGANC